VKELGLLRHVNSDKNVEKCVATIDVGLSKNVRHVDN